VVGEPEGLARHRLVDALDLVHHAPAANDRHPLLGRANNKIKKSLSTSEESGFFEPYAYYAKTLRAWLVAYGVGGPALIITHPETLRSLSNRGCASTVGWLFFCGVAAQVLIAFLNKIAMWYIYRCEAHSEFIDSFSYKCADEFSENFWLDILLDLVSIICFTIATILVFKAALQASVA
jgi:hypothetical protein